MAFPALAVFIQETGEEGIVEVFCDADLEGAIDDHPEWIFLRVEGTRAEFESWVRDMERDFA